MLPFAYMHPRTLTHMHKQLVDHTQAWRQIIPSLGEAVMEWADDYDLQSCFALFVLVVSRALGS